MAKHNNGVLLLHARTETAWFRGVWDHADTILFLGRRMRFCNKEGVAAAANSGAPIVLAAFGGEAVRRLQSSELLKGALVSRWSIL